MAAPCRTFKFRLYPTSRQVRAILQVLDLQRELYNAALEARIGAWRLEKRRITYFDDCRTLTELREVRPDVLACGVTLCRGTLKRLDRAYQGFFQRVARGEKPGYPRFKSKSRFDSLQWEDRSGWRIDEVSGRLSVMGIGSVKIGLHRPIRGVPKTITIKRAGRHFYVSLHCAEVPQQLLELTGKEVGIDLGVNVLVATSDGELAVAPRHLQASQAKLSKAQQALGAKHRGSKRSRKAAQAVGSLHRKIARQRKDDLHKISRHLVDDYDLIVHEALSPKKMSRRPKPRPDPKGGFAPNGASAKSGLNRAILDSGWSMLLAMISYKAEDAGRRIIAVNPRNTSRRCSACGYVDKDNRRGERFSCLSCGHEAHADLNAAINILRAGRARQRATAA